MKYTCISKTSNRIFMLQIERYLLGMLTLLSCIKITFTNSTTKYKVNSTTKYKVILYSHALNLCHIQIFMFHVYFFVCKNTSKNIKNGQKVGVVGVKVITKRLLTKTQPQIVQPKCGFVYYCIYYMILDAYCWFLQKPIIFLYLSNSGNSDF